MGVEAVYREIGEMIRLERESAEISQTKLAFELNLTRTSITNIESGRQRIPLHLIYNICKFLDIGIHKVLPSDPHKEKTYPLPSYHGEKFVPQKTFNIVKKYSQFA